MAFDLVTGGAGFIGRHVVEALLNAGRPVRVLDIASIRGNRSDCEVVEGSITDPAIVERTLEGAERVFHLAALPELWRRERRDFEAVNVEGTRTVLEAAARAGARSIVYTSTESILKRWWTDEPPSFGERFERMTPRDVPGPYCRSKLAADRIAADFARRGAPIVIVHPTLPVGPGDVRVTPPTRMILDFINGRHGHVLDAQINMVDVRDAALGHVRAAEVGVPGERFLLGHSNVGLRDLLRMIEDITGRPMARRRVGYPLALAVAAIAETWSTWVSHREPVATVAGVRLVRSPLNFDCDAYWSKLGIRPRPLERSIRDMIADFEARGLLKRPLEAGIGMMRREAPAQSKGD